MPSRVAGSRADGSLAGSSRLTLHQTRVSVVLPVRDGAPHIEQAIRSILVQTMPDFELLVVDDGSADGTELILARLAAGDARLIVLRQDRSGLVAALNRGLAEARGAYVARMDADDFARPERLACQAKALDEAPDVALVGSACAVMARDGRPLGRTILPPLRAADVHAALAQRNCIVHPTVMFRRDVVRQLGGYRPAFLLAEDFDVWLRLREHHGLINLATVLLDYRQHLAQSAWREIEQRILSEMGALAAANYRAANGSDGANGPAPVDRSALRRWGMTDAAISDGIVARSLGAAKDALAAGHAKAVRAAVSLGLRQPTLTPRTRAHFWLLRARALG